ncbi:MAG: hypothetical protein AB1489_24285 [Acidobacteriota bacterium]
MSKVAKLRSLLAIGGKTCRENFGYLYIDHWAWQRFDSNPPRLSPSVRLPYLLTLFVMLLAEGWFAPLQYLIAFPLALVHDSHIQGVTS